MFEKKTFKLLVKKNVEYLAEVEAEPVLLKDVHPRQIFRASVGTER